MWSKKIRVNENKRQNKRALAIPYQTLEPRNLLAGVAFNSQTGTVYIVGTPDADSALVAEPTPSQVSVNLMGVVSKSFAKADVNEIVFRGLDGNDWFKNDTTISSRAYGHGGHDTLVGGSSRDVLNGGLGNDSIYGHEGNDVIRGFDGLDRLFGNEGHDWIAGGDHSDIIIGGEGNDAIRGDNGFDRLMGQLGNDWISGGNHDDQLFGQEGDDRIRGDDGHDDIWAGDGDDIVRGGPGSDDLYGQNGSDNLGGESGDDDLYGGSGIDRLSGGHGNDDYYSDSLDSISTDFDDFSSAGDFEIRGLISNLDTANQSFTMLGIPVSYPGAELEGTLADGAFFKAEGMFDGTQLHAREVEQEIDEGRRDNFEAVGTVVNLDSVNQTFSFLGLSVDYSNAQVHGAIDNGVVAKVEGQLNGLNANAREVSVGQFDDNHNGNREGTAEFRGQISNLNTVDKTFSLLGLTFSYANAQLMGQLTNGAPVKADGVVDGNNVIARQVELDQNDDRDRNFEGIGEVNNLNESEQTFEFLGFTVDYSTADVRDTFGNGDVIEVDGWFENGSIDASEIKT